MFKTVLQQTMAGLNFQNMQFLCNGERYPIGHDSKLVSKLFEIVVAKEMERSLPAHGYQCLSNSIQNAYPDIPVKDITTGETHAVDVKTSYLTRPGVINGFTLGTYAGYFRNPSSTRCTYIPYGQYKSHLCVCLIYKRGDQGVEHIHTVVKEKWELASRSRGSGNTKNIGSLKNVEAIQCGPSCFHNEEEFHSFWSNVP